jgi:transcriptional regulator with XRE-family HTH domain
MAGKADNPVSHFGKQLKKERLARGWSLPELSRRTGIDAGHLSRIENGKRPPTTAIAQACDAALPERKGWFSEFYEESRTWAPPGFRSWAEYEDNTTALRAWSPGVIDGLLQSEAYARALLQTSPGVSGETVTARLAARIDRQRRVLQRDDPLSTWFVVDHTALYRCVGSADAMAAQMRHLLEVAARPDVTVQVLPAVAHPATQSSFMVADDAAYAEHVAGGYVFTDQETVSSLLRLFNSIQVESYRASESLTVIAKAGELWTGARQATAGQTAASALSWPVTAG